MVKEGGFVQKLTWCMGARWQREAHEPSRAGREGVKKRSGGPF